MAYLALPAPDSVVLEMRDITFARALEDYERRGMKENFKTFIQFRSGRVHYLYMEYVDFLHHFARAADAQGNDVVAP